MGSSLLHRTQPLLLGALFLAATLLGSACNGRPRLDPDAGMSGGTIRGIAIKGRISGGTVRVFRLTPAAERGAEVATAPTGEDGSFTVAVGASEGPFLVAVRGGSFRDEASGALINLNADELTAIVPSFSPGTQVEGLLVTPVSHLAAALTFRYVQSEALSIAAAHDEAWLHLNSHFGNIDWKRVVPKDLTSDTGSQFDQPARAGLLLAGLSMQARIISENASLTPGGGVQSLSLTQALYADAIADGFFDGIGPNGRIVLPPGGAVSPTKPTAYELDDYTLRFALAQAVVRFLQSDKKTYNLSTTDVTQLLQDLSRNSNSRIFRASKPGHAFYNQPPAVTFTAKYRGTDGLEHDPFGSANHVAGLVTITADANGPSGVKSLVVRVGNAIVPPQSQGNTPSHYVGTWDTRGLPDGLLTFTAHAVDLYDNAGTTDFTISVDNSTPTITVTHPSVGAYSATVSFEALAADPGAYAAGLSGFRVQGVTGFEHGTDTATNHITGEWTIPTGHAEGTLVATYRACDQVFNCTTTPISLNIDRTPPTVQLASGSTVVPYTSNPMASFRVLASDGAVGPGVRAVKAQRAGGPIVEGELDSATNEWLIPGIALNEGPNTILVWAEDLAQPANSGATRSPPYELTLSSWKDTQPPQPVLAANPSYFDERTMDVGVDGATGLPYIPAQDHYFWPSATRKSSAVPAIYKSVVRRSWGPEIPSALDLEGENRFNTPFIHVSVENSPVSSPLTSATFRVGTGPATALIPSRTTVAGQLLFLAPISAETFPPLASMLTSPARFSITVTLVDSAGHTASTSIGPIEYNLVGSPIQVVQDTGYGGLDPKSSAAFSKSDESLARLWRIDSGAFLSGYDVRLVRYILRNPHSSPVLVVLSSSGAWSATDTWEDRVWFMGPPPRGDGLPDYSQKHAIRSGDGVRWEWTSWQFGTSGASCGDSGGFFCSDGRRQWFYYDGRPECYDPDNGNHYCCSELDQPPPASGGAYSTSPGNGTTRTQVFNSDGTTPTPLAPVGPTRFLVPAASGGTPGELNVYVTRAWTSQSTALYRYVDLGIGTAYWDWHLDYFPRTFGYQCCLGGCAQYDMHRQAGLLTSAIETGSGTLTLKTTPTSGDFVTFGVEHDVPGAGPFSFTINH